MYVAFLVLAQVVTLLHLGLVKLPMQLGLITKVTTKNNRLISYVYDVPGCDVTNLHVESCHHVMGAQAI